MFGPFPNPKNSPIWPQKVKNYPKIKQNKYQNLRKHKKWKLFNYMSTPQNSFQTLPQPPKQPLRAEKESQKWPQNWVKIKCQSWRKQRKWKLFNYMSRLQINVEPYPNPKNSPLGPPKLKKLPQNQVKIKYQNWRKHRKWKLFNYMSRPQNSIWILPQPPQKNR